MNPELRIVTQMPLHELWNDHGVVRADMVRELSSSDIIELLREGSVRFVITDVGHLWHGRHHPVGHFILLYFGLDLGVAKFLVRQAIQLGQVVKHASSAVFINPIRIIEVQDRVFAVAELNALMNTVQESIGP